MILKKERIKRTVLQAAALFFAMSLAIFTVACPDEKDEKTTNIIGEEEVDTRTQVTLSSVTANGEMDTTTTTELTLTFSAVIAGLTADDITLSGSESVTKGTLSNESAVYTLPIDGFSHSEVLHVAVSKEGYNIIGSGKEVTIHVQGEIAESFALSKEWGTEFTPVTLGLFPGNDTSEVRLNWYSSGGTSGKEAKVRFIRGTKEAGYSFTEVEGAVAAAGSSTSHKVTVESLIPGYSYQYSVSNDGTNWSPMYNYKIPAANASFKFAIIADPQLTTGQVDRDSRVDNTMTTASGWLQTMEKIVAAGVSFIASCGDQVDATAGNETEYNNLFAPAGLRSLPMAPTHGNHDAHAHFDYHFNLPNEMTFSETRGTNNRANYYYLYNNILFVVLNTAQSVSTSNAGTRITQYRETIQAAKAKHTGNYDWLIVKHHKSTASVGDHCADTDIQAYVVAGFETLMSDEKVDFVLAGHDHVYARSFPLKGMDGGKVSVPMKTGFDIASGSTWSSPLDPIYLTFTTASGLKYYSVAADKTYDYNNTLYVKNNTLYPYLGDITGDASSTQFGSTSYLTGNYLPVSNAAFVQPYIPSYTIVEVNGRSITFKTYPIFTSNWSGTETRPTNARDSNNPHRSYTTVAHDYNLDMPYDVITITK